MGGGDDGEFVVDKAAAKPPVRLTHKCYLVGFVFSGETAADDGHGRYCFVSPLRFRATGGWVVVWYWLSVFERIRMICGRCGLCREQGLKEVNIGSPHKC